MADQLRNFRASLAAKIQPVDVDDEGKLGFSGRGALGTVADVISVVSLLAAGVTLFFGDAFAEAAMAVTLCALTSTFLVLNFALQRKFARESKRAMAGPTLVLCHRKLRDALVALLRGETESYSILVAEAAHELASAFRAATDQECRVAIQDVTVDGDTTEDRQNAEVTTLCRSFTPEHGSREHSLHGTPAVAKDNTDFMTILDGAKVFYSNDLSRLRHYKNSHFDVTQPAASYPYRSTIVWPIVGPSFADAENPEQIIGFLSVDAERPGVFTRHLDVPTGKAVASALYSSLGLYRLMREQEAKAKEQGKA